MHCIVCNHPMRRLTTVAYELLELVFGSRAPQVHTCYKYEMSSNDIDIRLFS